MNISWVQQILAFFQSNQIILTAMGLGGAGTIILWLKGIPNGILAGLKRIFITELEISSNDRMYYDVLNLVKRMYRGNDLRKLKVINGRYGDGDAMITMGYGTHRLKYKNTFMLVTLTKDPSNQSGNDKSAIIFRKFGRDHKLFHDLVKEAQTLDQDKSQTRIYKMHDGWSFAKKQKKRPLDSIFIQKDKKEFLLSAITEFQTKEEWYLSHGIPYQLGILLYGPPGTGKTSLIRALASYLDTNIYYLPAGKLTKIEEAGEDLPEKSIMVIEDIDSNFLTIGNNVTPTVPETRLADQEANMMSSATKIGLSELLNSLDGMFSSHGRILIATTNHIENLDPALIRPGRIDIKMEIGYVDKEILTDLLDAFFPTEMPDLKGMSVRYGITIAVLQNMILEGKSSKEIVEYCSE